MEIALSIAAIVLAILGIIGCILPIVPGVIISYGGLLCLYFCPSAEITLTELIIYGVIAIVLTVVDFILPSFFSKKFGGSKAGQRGAMLGLIVGILLGCVGTPIVGLIALIVCPCAGAVIGEIIHDKSDKKKAFIVGLGSFISFFVGTIMKLIYSLILLSHIVCVIWNMAVPHVVEAYDTTIDWLTNLF